MLNAFRFPFPNFLTSTEVADIDLHNIHCFNTLATNSSCILFQNRK